MADDVLSGAEAASLGPMSRAQADAWVARALARSGAGEADAILFRAGRIDIVYGVRTRDGRRLVVKVHRPPADLAARAAAVRAQRALAAAGFPCATPVAGPAAVDGRVVSVETLLAAGRDGDPSDPVVRATAAGALAEHVAILRAVPGLVAQVGAPPAWCRHEGGPWPEPHDTIFDFRATPPGHEWLDDHARRAAAAIAGSRAGDEIVAGHADWDPGNLRFDGAILVAAFDWDLVADTEPVVAGIAAASFTVDPAVAGPAALAAFLADFEAARGRAFGARGQRAAAAAAAWVLGYNARCQLALLDGAPEPGSPLAVVERHGREILALGW